MKTKPFLVKLNPGTHAMLKFRARQLGVTIGEMMTNLVSSYELRLARARETADIEAGEKADRLTLAALLEADREGWDEKRLAVVMEQIQAELSIDRFEALGFTPEIKVPNRESISV